jgi:hypothetical protein
MSALSREILERTDVRNGRLLIPGQTCWRVQRADQFACIVDAADYFHHWKAAIIVLRWLVRVRPKLEVYLLRSNVRLLPAFEGLWGRVTPVALLIG